VTQSTFFDESIKGIGLFLQVNAFVIKQMTNFPQMWILLIYK